MSRCSSCRSCTFARTAARAAAGRVGAVVSVLDVSDALEPALMQPVSFSAPVLGSRVATTRLPASTTYALLPSGLSATSVGVPTSGEAVHGPGGGAFIRQPVWVSRPDAARANVSIASLDSAVAYRKRPSALIASDVRPIVEVAFAQAPSTSPVARHGFASASPDGSSPKIDATDGVVVVTSSWSSSSPWARCRRGRRRRGGGRGRGRGGRRSGRRARRARWSWRARSRARP